MDLASLWSEQMLPVISENAATAAMTVGAIGAGDLCNMRWSRG